MTGAASGGIELIHVMERPVTLQDACLDCSGAIPSDALTREQLSLEARRTQGYIDGDDGADIEEPSVITLNAEHVWLLGKGERRRLSARSALAARPR